MKAFLLHRDRDADLRAAPPANADELVPDLELATLLEAMAGGDPFLLDVARRTLLDSLTDRDAIVYRQEILRDCLDHPAVVRGLYGLAVEAILGEKRVWGYYLRSPELVLHRALEVLHLFVGILRKIRQLVDANAGAFRSPGFRGFLARLAAELDDAFFAAVDLQLRELEFREGVLMSVALGKGLVGHQYVLRMPPPARRGWWGRMLAGRRPPNSFEVGERDEAGHRYLSELRDRGINLVANAVAQSTDHLLGFFTMLRAELGFYVGCLNLSDRLARTGLPRCTPAVGAASPPVLRARGLYDVCLALRTGRAVVGNEFNADGKAMVLITGANQGGKSTFLRSVGVAHLMLQCGLFVGASEFAATPVRGVFTHFKREEDASMTHGKLDEELHRMRRIVELLTPGSLLLCNESLSSTNEREGSEIARQLLRALTESGVRVLFVTFLYDLAQGLAEGPTASAVRFLVAERLPDGRRTFRIVEGPPLETSYGEDLYRQIFGTPGAASPAPVPPPSAPTAPPRATAAGPVHG